MEKSGLLIEDRRIPDLEQAIATRMVSLGVFSFEEYYQLLSESSSHENELDQLIVSLTVGETHFFRTPAQFDALRTCILPDLIRRKESSQKKLRIFSAGCATGEEPYSIVMLIRETFPELENWEIEVIACDINREFLDQARVSLYSERKLKLVSPEIRQRYFTPRGKLFELCDGIKKQVKFFQFNLTDPDYQRLKSDGHFDVIFCRNVLIYFNEGAVQHVVRKLSEILSEAGYLILGYSETIYQISKEFRSIHTEDTFFYQKLPSETRPWREIKVSLPQKRPLARDEWLRIIGSEPYTGPRLDLPRPDLTLPEPAPDRGNGEEKLWEEGMRLFGQEAFEKAHEVFERMLSRNPDSARGHLGMGFILGNRGEDNDARSTCNRVRELDALMPEVYLLQALLDEKNADLKEAVKNYHRVLWLDPEYIIAYFNLGNLYLCMNREEDARRQFKNALGLLEKKDKHFSLCFSGGLSPQALKQICLAQLNLPGTPSQEGSRFE